MVCVSLVFTIKAYETLWWTKCTCAAAAGVYCSTCCTVVHDTVVYLLCSIQQYLLAKAGEQGSARECIEIKPIQIAAVWI